MELRAVECFAGEGEPSLPLYPVRRADFGAWLEKQSPARAAYVKSAGFQGEVGRVFALPAADGTLEGFVAGVNGDDPFWAGAFASALPEAQAYRLDGVSGAELERASLAWALGAYQYTEFKAAKRKPARLVLPGGAPSPETQATAQAIYLVRDLVNAPAGTLGPAELEFAALNIARAHDADFSACIGEDLLRRGFCLIHAVGRAASREPRLIDFRWGSAQHPKLTLVGKGVVFDTGGLDIKPSSNMLLMRKDMGGAANVLGLAHMIMAAGLKVRLRVLIPAVENAISGNAYRPGDIIRSYKGLSVEIGNTDAEGRLILADALALADEENPDLLIDLATLTGAARTALGPDLPAFYCNDEPLAAELLSYAAREADPFWRMPLHAPYAKWLDTPFADINNNSSSSFAGSITAALFLQKFIDHAKAWAHFDIYAWNQTHGAARAIGGEAQTIRAIFRMLKDRFG